MNDSERMLFFELCKITGSNDEIIRELISKYATENILGYLCFNRMQGFAYGILREKGLLGNVNREFRHSLSQGYTYNVEKNKSYFLAIDYLSDVLNECKDKYAMLKGAITCRLFPEGYRTANDIDLLVRQEDITTVGDTLTSVGFKQGNIRNDYFVPASRSEIIESKMTRGETVPYIKEINLPYMRFLEVDINYSLDYKNSDMDYVSELINNSAQFEIYDMTIKTLNEYDFLIHLCVHLYKEATTYTWIKMKRDMTLYKYSDIIFLFNNLTKTEVDIFFERASRLNLLEICCCVIIWTYELFSINKKYELELSYKLLQDSENMLYEIIAPHQQKRYRYIEEDIKRRFFARDRLELLREL